MYAPELETLDQLLGCDMPLTVIAKLYSSAEAFRKGVTGLLSCGDVLLLDAMAFPFLPGAGERFSRPALTRNSLGIFSCA